MIGIILSLIVFGFTLALELVKPVLWAMTRLRLIYPVGFLLLGIVCKGTGGTISEILFYEILGIVSVGDILFVAICAASLYSLLKEIYLSINGFINRNRV